MEVPIDHCEIFTRLKSHVAVKKKIFLQLVGKPTLVSNIIQYNKGCSGLNGNIQISNKIPQWCSLWGVYKG